MCTVPVLLDAARNIESGLNANEYIVAKLKQNHIIRYFYCTYVCRKIYRRTPRRNSNRDEPSATL